jgi:hypothetical protein
MARRHNPPHEPPPKTVSAEVAKAKEMVLKEWRC